VDLLHAALRQGICDQAEAKQPRQDKKCWTQGHGRHPRKKAQSLRNAQMPNEAPRMADTSVTDTNTSGSAKSGLSLPLPSLEQLKDALWRGDLFLALGVMTILVVLIMPMPPFMLDLFLAVSIIFSVLVMMTALFIHKPLEFSAFPTVLLIATMMRWR
jgi:hypothetical protein